MRRLLITLLLCTRLMGTNAQSKSVEDIIKTTLMIIANEHWTLVDQTGDGVCNSVDYAIMFYNNYPDKQNCSIWCNAKLVYAFNAVKIDGVWVTVDPLAFVLWPKNQTLYTMKDLNQLLQSYEGFDSNYIYDSAYDYDAWYKYGRYCE